MASGGLDCECDGKLPFASIFSVERSYLADTIYGKIMRCRVKESGDLVAVKVYERTRADLHLTRSGHTVLEDAPTEISILKCLRDQPHAHLLGEHESGRNLAMGARVDYAPMPFADGGDLLTYLRENDVSPCVAARHFVRIASAVQHLHSMGWAHRDVSLENVLLISESVEDNPAVDAGVRPVLGDYGLAVRLGDCPAPTGCRPGKPGYMSPEIYQFKAYNAAENDVYSLGVVLFGLLARALPYNAPSHNDVAFRMIQDGRLQELLEAWSLSSRFRGGAVDLVSSMLHKDPSKRPSLEEVLAHRWCADAVAYCLPAAASDTSVVSSVDGADERPTKVEEDECKATSTGDASICPGDNTTHDVQDDNVIDLDFGDVADVVLSDSDGETDLVLAPTAECDECVCDTSLSKEDMSSALARVSGVEGVLDVAPDAQSNGKQQQHHHHHSKSRISGSGAAANDIDDVGAGMDTSSTSQTDNSHAVTPAPAKRDSLRLPHHAAAGDDMAAACDRAPKPPVASRHATTVGAGLPRRRSASATAEAAMGAATPARTA